MFLGVVLLCGVFFTLGYTIGRNDYSASAASRPTDSLVTRPSVQPKPVTKPADATANPPSPAANEWDFYSSKQDANRLESSAKPSTSASAPANSAPPSDAAGTGVPDKSSHPASVPVHYQPPRMAKTSIVLQLAALRRPGDAMALADELQQKKFPSFVVAPTTDTFYRVQVGPYSTEADAEAARHALDREGFKAIIKR